MPLNTQLAGEQWRRYTYCRDVGHINYVNKANKCEAFFAGDQWDPADLTSLRQQRRPALTINKTLGVLSSILGEQIDLRTEIAFKARYGSPSGNADTLTKLFRFISDRNQLPWVRSELFTDGVITSRGYIDMRMDFTNSLTGDIVFSNINPRNVIPDPDAWEADPDKWKDVIVTKWLSANDIALFYNEADAKELKKRSSSQWAQGYDSIDTPRNRFGDAHASTFYPTDMDPTARMIRVLERQYRKLAKKKYFINVNTGDKKEIPDSWDRDRIAFTLQSSEGQLVVDEVLGEKIRWTVTADEFVLHDDWSPYRHFTIIPYFPYLRYGRTIGLVENLLGPQELLNKTTSQELHVVNTTANSGWKVKKGGLKNMTPDELEQRGAQTGLVMELDSMEDAEKITPNQIPQGLSELSRKSENYIKTVSMRGDAQMGMSRADVSADQIEANNAAGDVGLRKVLDNLARTDHLIARNALDLIQEFYTDARIMTITKNALTGEQEDVKINWPDPSTGEIQGDVTMGEYDIVVIQQTARQSLEASQFEQAVMLREKLGIPIPDEFIIENSNLINKTGMVAKMKEQAESPEAQMQHKMQVMAGQLELSEIKGKIAKEEADAVLKRAKAAKEIAATQETLNGPPGVEQEMELERQRAEQDMALQREKHEQEMQMQREKAALDAQIKIQQSREDARLKRAQAIMAARQQPADKPGQEKKAA